jgi:hypothetical protein
MKNRLMTMILTGIVASSVLSSPAFAKTAASGGHPAIHEIQVRETVQAQRFQQGVSSGTISPTVAAQDIAARQTFNSFLASEVQANNGHLTKQEFVQANQRLNKASVDLYDQKH